MTGSVILLAPSCGLGGGIERYAETLEWALRAQGIGCRRVSLRKPGMAGHVRMFRQARAMLRAMPEPARLVVAHRALVPVAALLAGYRPVTGMSVICHGAEIWQRRLRPRRLLERALMGRPGVRLVAVSGFTAGAMVRERPATVLPPALSGDWFDLLTRAAGARAPSQRVKVLTAFRLADWRDKGLGELIAALRALGRADIDLTICGTGPPPAELRRVLSRHPWCRLRTDLSGPELADELAAADLFVLATRTRPGRRACGEGFGLVLLEAQVAGTPVVAPAHGGSSGAYLEGVTGLAPADESVEALAGVLAGLLADPSRLAQMGKRAGEWARAAYAPDTYAELAVRRLL